MKTAINYFDTEIDTRRNMNKFFIPLEDKEKLAIIGLRVHQHEGKFYGHVLLMDHLTEEAVVHMKQKAAEYGIDCGMQEDG